MNDVLEYIAKKNKHLQFCYRPEFGKEHDDCTIIAIKIREMLKKHGITAKIIRFSKDGDELMRPVVFDRKIGLGYHDAVVANGLVYDPILPKPIVLSEYIDRVFGENIPFREIEK